MGLADNSDIIERMPKGKDADDLSLNELRRLLMEKRRSARRERLERFRRSGRAVILAPDLPPQEQGFWHPAPPEAEQEAAPTPPPARRRWFDRLLAAIEVLAVIGLVGVLLSGLGLWRLLNQEAAAALRQAASPTPLITAVVLPGGHTPPTASQGAQPNEAEIPEHLRPLVQSLASLPIPTPGPEQAIRIQIPAINVDAPIVQGDGWEQLKKGVGQHIGSANPGQAGNLVLTGHNDVYGEVFRYLEKLQPGDLILIFTAQRQYVYVVTGSQIVEPTQVEVMNPTSEPTLTLITCHPYLVDKQRYVVFARLQTQ